MDQYGAEAGGSQSKVNIKDSEVVFGHRMVQTNDVKWLCIENIYQKFYRPNFYDIGGTHMQDVADYWFTFKTEQVGNVFLLHLFVCNHGVSSFNVAIGCLNQFNIDVKNKNVFLQQYLREFQFTKLAEMSHTYLTTYSFDEQDVEVLNDRKLYIAVSLQCDKNEGLSLDVINNVKINHDCKALLSDPIGSDFIMESMDGVKFNVHRVILGAHSEVFKAMLKKETAECQSGYVKLVDVPEDDLRLMLEFIYTGTIKELDNANFCNLMMVADRYNLQGLWELSQYALCELINLENVMDMLVLADMYDSDCLKRAAMKFIKNNLEVLNTAAFKKVNNADVIKELCMFLAM